MGIVVVFLMVLVVGGATVVVIVVAGFVVLGENIVVCLVDVGVVPGVVVVTVKKNLISYRSEIYID